VSEFQLRLDSAEAANAIRFRFGQLMRGVNAGVPLPAQLRNVYLSNVTTLTTKVRVDILRALADVLREDQENRHRHVFVSAFVSSPMLHINPAAQKGPTDGFRGMTFSYSEAVETFGNRLRPEDKYWAYRRVGRGFRGQLEALFVVMSEHEREKSLQSEPPSRRPIRSGQQAGASGSQYYRKPTRTPTPMPGTSASAPQESTSKVRSGDGKKKRDRTPSSSSSGSSDFETGTETEGEARHKSHKSKRKHRSRHETPPPKESSGRKKGSSSKKSSGRK
jgi:hypothetical protein